MGGCRQTPMATIPETLANGLKHQQAGRLGLASELYESVLRIEPDHPDALHLLGLVAHLRGEHGQAVEQISRAIAAAPNVAIFHSNLGAVYHDLNIHDKAATSCRRALRIDPNHAQTHNNLGSALANQGQLDEAVLCFKRCLEIAPDRLDALGNLAKTLKNQGKHAEAEIYYRRVLKITPDDAHTLAELGNVLQEQGKSAEAEACYRRALETKPDTASVLTNLGHLLQEQAKLEEAESCYRRALEIQPGSAHAYNGLAGIFHRRRESAEAINYYRRALSINPDFVEALNNLGNVLIDAGRPNAAEACYRRAVQTRPDDVDALANLAGSFEKHNRLEQAAAAAAECLRIAPDHPKAILVAATCEERQGRHQAAIDRLEELRRRGQPDASIMKGIQFGLGRAYDHLGHSAKAFDCFAHANRLVLAEAGEEIAQRKQRYLRSIDVSSRVFTKSWVESWSAVHPVDEAQTPAFLIGFPRSGTTLLDVILDSHPAIQTVEEKPMVQALVDELDSFPGGYPLALADLTAADVGRLREVYFRELDRYLKRRPGSLVIDKLPMNTVAVGPILRVFPAAKFIMAVRHPCDVCLSCFMQNFVINNAMASFFTLEDTATLYDKTMCLWRQYVEVLPHAYHVVKYEDLVEDFEGQTRRLLEFLGVDWDQAVHEYAEHARNRRKGWINTASHHQVVQPIYKRARGRWRRYADQLAPIMSLLKPHIEYFGYDS